MIERFLQRIFLWLFLRLTSKHRFLKPLFEKYKIYGIYPDLIKIFERLNQLEENQIKFSEFLQAQNETLKFPIDKTYRPLVSVIMPLYDSNSTLLKKALDSVFHQTYDNFELILIYCNLSIDVQNLIEMIDDKRMVMISSDLPGASYQRNKGLEVAKGEIISYLDDDNIWYPTYLEYTVHAFSDSQVDCTYTSQLVKQSPDDVYYIRSNTFHWQEFIAQGGIDGNVFAHRKALCLQYGLWDTDLTRLQDMDLILRYTRDKNPFFVPILGGEYLENLPGSISSTQAFHYNYWKIKKKNIERNKLHFRVLILTGIYHQITERYLDYELQALKEAGIEFAVWAPEKGVTADPTNPYQIFYGDLKEVIRGFQPDILHVFWLHVGITFREVLEKTNLPVTLRNHGFETNNEIVDQLTSMPLVKRIFVFPNYFSHLKNKSKLFPLPTSFSGEYFNPSSEKNKKLVVRAGACLSTKAFEEFIDTALLCPEFEFVLVLALTNGTNGFDQKIKIYNENKGNPVKLIGPLYVADMAALIKQAGIYMYTLADGITPGMPVSILEAMASACVVLTKESPDARAYYSKYALYYKNAMDAARIINGSIRWDDTYWIKAGKENSEFIFKEYVAVDRIRPVIQCWNEIIELK